MNINLGGLKQDYSFLFSSMNSSNNSSSNLFNSINLSDYNSIKSGTYGKLLKAYYKKEDADVKDTTSKKTTTEEAESAYAQELKEVQTDANALRDSANALMEKGSKSVFKNEDLKEVYSAVSKFAKDYNTLIEEGQKSTSSSVINGTDRMKALMKDYESSLNEIGITIDKEGKLAIDENAFMKSDIDKSKELFNGQKSLSYLTSMRAVSISNMAYSESNRSNLYTGNGSYSTLTTTDIFSSIV